MHKIKYVFVSSFLLISSLVFSQSNDEKAILQNLENLKQAMLNPNKEMLESLAHESLSYGHSSNTIRDKAGFVKEFLTGQTVVLTSEYIDQTIRIDGNLAIVRHRWKAETNKPNTPNIDVFVMQVWQKQKGKWLLFARQAYKVPQ